MSDPPTSPARGPRTVLVQSIFGPMVAFDGDFATRQIMAFGAHTRNEVAMLCSFVEPGDLVYDVGAHIGTFAIPLALAAGARGRVIAIEADADNFLVLRQNLDRHGLTDRVTPLLGLAGGQDGRYRREWNAEHTSATHFMPDAGGELIEGLRLDALDEGIGWPRPVAIIKIDVEGMELPVMRSAQRIIDRDRPILYVEIADHQLGRYNTTSADVEAFLRSRDYRFFRNVGDRNSTHDEFELSELGNLRDGGTFYDVLAVPGNRVSRHAPLAQLPKP